MAHALQSQLVLLGGTTLWADYEDERLRNRYRDRLAEPVQLEQSLPDILAGVQGKRSATVRVKHVGSTTPGSVDVTLADLQIQGEGLHGQPATVQLVDLDTQTAYLPLYGTISDLDEATGDLTVEELDAGVLQTDIPKRRVLDLFPNADLTRAPGNDPRLIKVFGVLRQVQLTCLSADRKDWGAVIPAASGTVIWNTVYRNKAVAAAADYTVVTTSGVQILRFVRAQPEDVEIRADLTSTEFANQAVAGQWILSDAIDGLGQAVDAVSFAAAIAALQAESYQVHHGIGPEPERAEDVLNELAVRGSVIAKNAQGAYTWTVDTPALHTPAQYQGRTYALGRGDGRWENITRVVSGGQTRIEERINDYTLLGLYTAGFGSEAYLLRARSARASKGTVVTVTNRYIGDIATLRKECGYRLTRLHAERYRRELEVTPEARVIQLNQRVAVRVPHLRWDDTNPPLPLIVKRLRGSRGAWTLELVGHDESQYGALAENQWSAQAASQLTDYTYTYPAVPTGFTLVGAATVVIGDQGKSTTFQKVQATAPAQNVTHLVFRLVRAGQSLPGSDFERPVTPGQSVQAEVSMESGLSYHIEYFARNKANDPAFQDGTIGQHLNYLAAGDSQVPATPTGLSAVAGTAKSINVFWNAVANSTIASYELRRNTVNNVGSAVLVSDALTTSYTDVNLSYGSSYYYWVRAKTRSGFTGAYAGPAGPIFVSQILSGDVGAGQIFDSHVTTVGSTKIVGSLTINPVGNIPALRITNGGDVQLDSTVANTSRLGFFENVTMRMKIDGAPTGMNIQPTSSNNYGTLNLGAASFAWNVINMLARDIGIVASNDVGISGSNVVRLISGTRIQLLAPYTFLEKLAGCSPIALPGLVPLSNYSAKAYIELLNANGGVYGVIPVL